MANTEARSLIQCAKSKTNDEIRVENETEPTRRQSLRHLRHDLNVSKCLAKQLAATYRVEMEMNQTGGGRRIYWNAGHYAELCRVSESYYRTLKKSEEVGFEITENVTKTSKARESATVRVWAMKRQASWGYTINLYHTKASALVNGNGLSKFLNEHLPDILELTDENRANILNNAVQYTLKKTFISSKQTSPLTHSQSMTNINIVHHVPLPIQSTPININKRNEKSHTKERKIT
ncbi:hypothetical protein SNE40_013068 [Patella caerulea]|uniref:Uncharacterized protein n=1 Tax=Patella caerulea TaxID=87958 RepID=A0AAN8JHE6_PATCE